jgi:hypothetical protein
LVFDPSFTSGSDGCAFVDGRMRMSRHVDLDLRSSRVCVFLFGVRFRTALSELILVVDSRSTNTRQMPQEMKAGALAKTIA